MEVGVHSCLVEGNPATCVFAPDDQLGLIILAVQS